MISHDTAFETLAKAPVKQTDVIVAKQVSTSSGYVDGTPLWSSSTILMDVKIDAIGEMLGTVTKKATVNLLGIVSGIQAKDLYQIRLGIYNSDPSVSGFDYISQGFFLVDSVDYNYDAGSTTITMYDHMWAASKSIYKDSIVGSAISYPATVQTLANYIASLLGVSLSGNFASLPNSQFAITRDLYSGMSGATLQNAIQDIAGATGSTARVTDTTLTFSQYAVSAENLDSDTLQTLKIGDTYGPVTSVVLGRVPQNDNVAIYANPPSTSAITAVNTTTDVLTSVGHNMVNGNMIRVASTGTLPAPLQANIAYYVASVTADTFKLAPTYSDGVAGTNTIDITTAGTGTITVPTLAKKEIQINNNQIVDNDRQTLLPPLYNKLSGIDWTEVKADTIGLGWHEVGDVIQFTQGAVTAKAFLSEVHLVLSGSIEESLASKVPDVAAINYQSAGGILKTLYNTEIKVDKQDNTITSIVAQQTEFEGNIEDDFTQLRQDVTGVKLTIQKSGGGNLLLNSVGYAKEQHTDTDGTNYGKLLYWDYNTGYTVAQYGSVTSYDSTESLNYGGLSGRVVQMSDSNFANSNSPTMAITQRVSVAANTSLSFGLLVRNSLGGGSVMIRLTNDNDTFLLPIDDSVDRIWQEKSISNFTTTMSWLDVTIEARTNNFMFTDLRLLYGDTLQGWTQSNAEILSANVQFTKDGMRIFDESHDTETQVTYNEFSTRRRSDGAVLFEADDSGIVVQDATIKGSTNYMLNGQVVIKQITIPASNPRGGIAFVRVT